MRYNRNYPALALLTGYTTIQTVQMTPDGRPYVVLQVVPDWAAIALGAGIIALGAAAYRAPEPCCYRAPPPLRYYRRGY